MRSLVCALCATLGLLAATPAVAAPGFSAPRTLAGSATKTYGPPAVAIDALGRSLVAWRATSGRIMVRRGDAAGHFGRARSISPRSTAAQTATLAQDGTAVVTWRRDLSHGLRQIEVAVARPGRGFGRPQVLASVRVGIGDGRVVVAGGRIVVVWSQGREVRYAIAAPGARFGPAHSLARMSDTGRPGATSDPAGSVIVTWATPLESDAGVRPAIATLPVGADRFGPPQFLPIEDPTVQAIGVAPFAGPGGLALGYGVVATRPWPLLVAARAPDGSFGAPVKVTDIDNPRGTNAFAGPFVALPAQGGEAAVWMTFSYANQESERIVKGAVFAAARQPDGSFAAPVRLSAAKEIPSEPLEVAATTAAVVAVWPAGRYDRARVRYVVRPAGVGFSAPRTLGTGADRGITLSAAGEHAIVGWAAAGKVRIATLRG